MNAMQVALAGSWTGPRDERYFDALRALDRGDDDGDREGGQYLPPHPEPVADAPSVSGESSSHVLAGCVATFRRWLHLPDPGALYVTLAAVAANRADGDPVWLLVVGPPGGGKTEILAPLTRLPYVHPAATLTEAALLSGTPKKERSASARGGLLRVIGAFGIILAKDFGSVLSMNRDARAAVLAALREVYDGSWTRHVGTDGGQTLTWEGKVGLIAGCTPAIDNHHAVIGSMGERFLLYRLPKVDAEAQVRRAFGHVGTERTMRVELGTAIEAVLDGTHATWLTKPPDDETTERLVALSTLAVRCRSAVERDSYTREVLLIPEPEAPARLALVLLRVLNALRAIGLDAETTWQLVTKCALDSMPAIRRTLAEDLLAHPGDQTTTEIAERTKYPTTTARRGLEDLEGHGITERRSGGQGRADMWQMTAWARERWPGATVPETSEGVRTDAQDEAGTVSISLPLRVFDNKTGTVPDDEGRGPSAFDGVPT